MAEKFDIIEFLSGLTNYVFDKAVLKTIALGRDVAIMLVHISVYIPVRKIKRCNFGGVSSFGEEVSIWVTVDSKLMVDKAYTGFHVKFRSQLFHNTPTSLDYIFL